MKAASHYFSWSNSLIDNSCRLEPGREERQPVVAISLHCNLCKFLSSKLIFLTVSAHSVQGFAVLSISCTVPEVSQATDLTPAYSSKHRSRAGIQLFFIFYVFLGFSLLLAWEWYLPTFSLSTVVLSYHVSFHNYIYPSFCLKKDKKPRTVP